MDNETNVAPVAPAPAPDAPAAPVVAEPSPAPAAAPVAVEQAPTVAEVQVASESTVHRLFDEIHLAVGKLDHLGADAIAEIRAKFEEARAFFAAKL